ncbi:MAG TPA: hypothetical protein VHB21_11240, partial [Minicystis sp.]|nr:hypothetical protein [Minicystis sp.]
PSSARRAGADPDADAPPTPAQLRAVRALVDDAATSRDRLLEGLFRDQLTHREGSDFEPIRDPDAIPGRVALENVIVLHLERDGVAYVLLRFEDAWRVEHGLAASWLEAPHPAVVALPMWEGRPGRFRVEFVAEDDDELELTGAQIEAATRLVEDGDAIRDAFLAALLAQAIASRITAKRIRIHAEELDGLAYSDLVFDAAWRKSGKARVLMWGARVVGMPTRDGVDDAIAEDQDAALRAKRAKKPARRRR